LNYTIIDSADKLQSLRDWLPEKTMIGCDLETNSLGHVDGTVVGIAIGDSSTAFYIIRKRWTGVELVTVIDDVHILLILQSLLSKRIVNWNINFDARFLRSNFNVDIAPSIYADPMTMLHCLDENRFAYKLKEVAAEFLGADINEDVEALKKSVEDNGGSYPSELYKADQYVLGRYACGDVIKTMRLFNIFDNRLKAEGLSKFYYDDEYMPLLKHVLVDATYHGVPVDVEFLQRSRAEIVEAMDGLEAQILRDIAPQLTLFQDWYLEKNFSPKRSGGFLQAWLRLRNVNLPLTKTGNYSTAAKALTKLAPDSLELAVIEGREYMPAEEVKVVQKIVLEASATNETFNLASKDHLKVLFIDILKEQPLSRTEKTQAPQIDDDFLDAMAAKYEWAQTLRTWNRLQKIKGSYINQYLDGQVNGIYYPQMHQHRTVSGRLSGDMQQLPRPISEFDDKGKRINDPVVVDFTNRIRAFFRTSDDEIFADFDYDSQEVRVFAHVSGDDAIKSIFHRGDDFYSHVCIGAERLEGFSASKKAENYLGKKNKDARQRAKAYALGFAFGMTAYKLKFELDISESEAAAIEANYFASFPKLKQTIEESKKFALTNGYVKVESGRVRRFPRIQEYYRQYGDVLFNGLDLWKQFNEMPASYARAKEVAGKVKNYVNNAMNVKAQGFAASITAKAAVEIAKALKAQNIDGYICAITHDQITVRCKLADLKTVAPLMSDKMANTTVISVPLPAPPGWGNTFAESKNERDWKELENV